MGPDHSFRFTVLKSYILLSAIGSAFKIPPLKQRRKKFHPIEIVVSTNVLNFGDLTQRISKKMIVKLTNFGEVPVTFELIPDKTNMEQFKIEPLKVSKLPPGKFASLTISYNPRRNDEFIGKFDVCDLSSLICLIFLCFDSSKYRYV